MLHVMVMAGGGGTRFWPRSRNARPKQFLTFSGDRSLLQATIDRTAAVVPPARTWVVTGAAYVGETANQLPELPADHIVGEPFRRDTAPCVGLGAALIAATDPDATIVVTPADHVIEPEREYQRALHAAEQFAADHPECLFTFGIRPTFASTGYGYIHRGPHVSERNGVPLYRVNEFKEKPSADVAAKFVESGEYDWNSGIFVWKATTILGQLRAHRPDIHAACIKIAEAWNTPNRLNVFRDTYEAINGTSIDFAVMQEAGRAGLVRVLRAPYTWDDVGSWLALERHNPQDADGNTFQGEKAVFIDTSGCVVSADPDHLIAAIGVTDLVIIQAGKAVLVARKQDEARVKEVVEKLKKQGPEHL
ncbi:MAG: sugar phosphate nucleotidyltransferase [Fimbriiglobus sp.]|nr:sugar phosphate nucleotidyltransferase [Fimbriiglobus sp.]